MELKDNPIFIGDDGRTAASKKQLPADVEWTSPPNNAEVADDAIQPASFLQLFRFASFTDVSLISLAVLTSLISGVCLPGDIVVFGVLVDALTSKDFSVEEFTALRCNATNTTDWSLISGPTLTEYGTLSQVVNEFAIWTGIFAAISIACNLIFITCMNVAAENQIHRLRGEFLKAVLRQDISWYDQRKSNDFASRITEDLNKIQEGIGEKLGIVLSFLSTGISGIIVAFFYGWELTLVALITAPLTIASTSILGQIQTTLTAQELATYAVCAGIAEEIISSIRTVVVFGGQEKEVDRFQEALYPARNAGIKRGLFTGIASGLTWFLLYSTYALTFWYGVNLIVDNCTTSNGYNAGSLSTIFFCVLYASMKIGQLPPLLEAVSMARGAAASIYSIIDRVPQIDSSSPAGKLPAAVQGNIRFANVHFRYPSRPDVTILNGIDFQVSAGQTVALVGLSGCGKSTCIQLLQRFYDPCGGHVELDGNRLSDLNIKWLRSQIGVVGQEPVLFGTTIAANIRYGREGLSQGDVERAAKEANAHDFISQLPLGYETMVGERGAQMSGGQKQRIAIARALVRNPKILLFDEATSALDTQSEAVVQRALDRARCGRTTIIVAHRLTTIRNADLIFVLDKGVVKEAGNHDTLTKKRGIYYQLVLSQQKADYDQNNEKNVMNQPLCDDEDVTPSQTIAAAAPAFLDANTKQVSSAPISAAETDSNDSPDISLWKILQYNRPEWFYIAMGILGSLMVGLVPPLYAVVFGRSLGILDGLDIELVRSQGNFCAIMYLLVAIAAGIGTFLQSYMLSVAGENLTCRLRALTIKSILNLDMSFFDREENSVGSLCSRLSSDASNIQGVTGGRLGMLIQILTSTVASLSISLYLNWKLGLALSVVIPFVLGSGALQVKISLDQTAKRARTLEKASQIAMESISNIRTVASLSLENTFHSLYMDLLLEPHTRAKQSAALRGLLYALTVNTAIIASIGGFYYGTYLVMTENLDLQVLFMVTESLIFGFEIVGQMLAFTPNYGKARIAAKRVFHLIETNEEMEKKLSGGSILQNGVAGKVQMEEVHFSYPTRRNVPILRGFSALIKPGQTVALVGQSGCGKSTCIQLLQRFYDPDCGTLSVDNLDVKPLNVASFRSQIGIVSQEPVLFNRTIGENIAYGDQTRSIGMEEIIEVAKKANIHNFIKALPLGYDTMVGQRGTQLSGGQKQRVAIARALVRNPKILLLDEATSALDSESEKVVQEALDNASQGRTCITIAHRLSTIQNADHIFVVHRGEIREQGRHEDLLQLGGIYHRLWTVQVESKV